MQWIRAIVAMFAAVFALSAAAQQPQYGAPISAENAKKAAAAAIAEARKNSWNMVVAIVDPGGHLVYFERMDTAQIGSVAIAQDKAHAAAIFRRSTKSVYDEMEKGRTAAETRRSTTNWQERIKTRPELVRMPGVTPVHGGLPIIVEGSCVGAVGISGVQSHEDEQIAAAGIKVLE